jgi:hypothetical protein
VDTPVPPGALEGLGDTPDPQTDSRNALRQVRDGLREILTLLDRDGKIPG